MRAIHFSPNDYIAYSGLNPIDVRFILWLNEKLDLEATLDNVPYIRTCIENSSIPIISIVKIQKSFNQPKANRLLHSVKEKNNLLTSHSFDSHLNVFYHSHGNDTRLAGLNSNRPIPLSEVIHGLVTVILF